ncbi:MAG: endonuclease, partial [Bacteroidales bacterium]|nr:endonuclease [Bacteroidales bacterium]
PFLIFSSIIITTGQAPVNHGLDDTQKTTDSIKKLPGSSERFRIVFYNLENLFDTKNDSAIRDDEFTPDGIRAWNNFKFQKKIINTYKTIIAIGEFDPPAVIGVCEIENRVVLQQLTLGTPLKKFNYKIIHRDSPDRRGIDVALLFRPSRFQPLFIKTIPINYPFDTLSRTRDILYVKGVALNSDTLHLFINHWASRYGGYMPTKRKREYIARQLRSATDSILNKNSQALIVVTGDFNDEPWDESLRILTKQTQFNSKDGNRGLINLLEKKVRYKNSGTIKWREYWQLFDQFLISFPLLNPNNKIFTRHDLTRIFDAEFLLEEDNRYFGQKPFRTYGGYRYQGGFSDHLPIFLDLITTD